MGSDNGQLLLPTVHSCVVAEGYGHTNVKYYGEMELPSVNFAIAR